jgi:hypothetical protein
MVGRLRDAVLDLDHPSSIVADKGLDVLAVGHFLQL